MPFLKKLNPAQHGAVVAPDGPLLLLAGAGTGKTRVLTTRIAHMIRDRGVAPGNILAVTFTNKAAGEMKERLTALLGEEMVRGIWLGTFHSIGLRILRREGDLLDMGQRFTVFNDDDQMALIKLILKELNLSDKALAPRAVSTRINQAKNEFISPDEYLLQKKDFFSERVQKIYALYEEKMRAMKAADFGDLITGPIKLFKKHPHTLGAYQGRFKHILVDEYQDTNRAQYLLMNMLAEGYRNICVVGDPDQSIYGWRGADIQNILDFKKDWDEAEVIKLEQNYRSTQNILAAANSIIENNSDRLEKELWTENMEGNKVRHMETQDERDEVRTITRTLREVMREDPKLGMKDIAVFYRTNAQSRVFEEHFIREAIPYHIVGGLKFYDRKEIKDAVAMLKLVMNPSDLISFRRVVNTPPRGIGKVALDRIEQRAAADKTTPLETLRLLYEGGELKKKALKGFLDAYKAFEEEGNSLHDRVKKLIEDTGYMDMLVKEGSEESLERADNLHELVSAVKDYETAVDEPTLEAFLDQVALVSDVDSYTDKVNRLTLMTIHSAKGLEFPVVFVAGMEENLFPHSRSVASPKEMEEERRLCYVAMTRAQKRLFLTSASSRTVYGETRFQIRSRFIDEIDRNLLDSPRLLPGPSSPKSNEHYYTIDESQLADISSEPVFSDGPEPSSNGPSDGLGIGMRVKHASFGPGVIRAKEGMGGDAKVTVDFQIVGIKKLIAKYASLEVLT